MSYKEEIRREMALRFALKNCDHAKHPALVVEDAEVFYEFLKGDDNEEE